MSVPIQATSNSTGGSAGTSLTLTFGQNVTAGNSVVVCVLSPGSLGGTVTLTPGSGGDTFTRAVLESGSNGTAIYYNLSSSGGYTTIAISASGSLGGIIAYAYEVNVLTALDKTASGTSSSASTWTSNTTATTTQANEIAFGIGGMANATATAITGPSSPWVNEGSFTSIAWFTGENMCGVSGYDILTATGTATYSGTGTSSGGAANTPACVATFKYTPPPPSSGLPQIQPGPTWLAQFKPGMPRPRPVTPPSGPWYGNLPNLSDLPQIAPGSTWVDQFKPGLRRPRPLVPSAPGALAVALGAAAVTIAAPAPTVTGSGVALGTAAVSIAAPQISVGESFPLGVATVTIATPAPTLSGAGVALSTAMVTIGAPPPGAAVSVALSPATVVIGTPAPAVSPGVGLSAAAVTITAYQVTPRVTQPDLPQLMPGPAWVRHFKPGLRRPVPFNPQRITPGGVHLGVCAVTITVPPIGTPPKSVALSPATVTITAYPVKPSRLLLLSIATVGGQDDYGNTYYPGVCSYGQDQIGALESGFMQMGGASEFDGSAGQPGVIGNDGPGQDSWASSTTSGGDTSVTVVLSSANQSGQPDGEIELSAGTVTIGTGSGLIELIGNAIYLGGFTIPYPAPSVTTADGAAIVAALQAIGIFS
jgi:hypothetical protein